jgi:CHASE2 domain-containing sensor protein
MSAVTLPETDAPAHHEGSWWQRVREHIAHEWASALLVASLVTIANLHFHWLRAFDTYTFLALGQLSSVSLAGFGKQYRTVVVEIDQPVFENEFEEKTPLDRTQLKKYLEAIYAAKPDIVVVDLDISPMFKPAADSGTCSGFPASTAPGEEGLYSIIKDAGTSAEPITTVLLEPFPTENKQLACWRDNWRTSMASKHVVFGDGEVPVRYGVHAELSDKDESLVRKVERAARAESAEHDHSKPDESKAEPARRLDPRQLLKGVQLLPLSKFVPETLTNTLTFELGDAVKLNPHHKKVVFFGAAYGGDDLFLTAVGEIYGVEAHAAGYVSDIVEDRHVVDFGLDFVIAIVFGLVIAFFWRKYFDARLSDNAVTRELAKLWVIGLVLSVLSLVVFLSFVSLLLLRFGIWLSPIPLAIGMLFDSFVSGSVDQATHKFKTLRRELIERFSQQPAVVGVHVDHSVTVSVDPATDEVTMREVREELVESYAPAAASPPARPHRRRAPRDQELSFWGARHLPRALGGDICEHLLAHKKGAAALLGLWTVIWMSTAIFALVLASH